MSWLLALLSTDIAQWIAGALAALAGLSAWGWKKKREGAKEQAAKAKEEDSENAEDIRKRVARDLADELRKHEGRGYRD